MDNYSPLRAGHLLTDRGFASQLSGSNLPFGLCGAVPESIGLVTRLDDMAVVGEPVQQCRGHLCIPEYGRPFRKCQIRSDQYAGVFIEFGQ